MFDTHYILPSEALRRLLEMISQDHLSVEKLGIDDCCGRILASDIVSGEDLPDFFRSTVDGFSVISSDTFGAKETAPAYLSLKNEVLMGVMPDFSIKKGESAKIPTGGMLPDGADAVVMLEQAQIIGNDTIEVFKAAAPFENVIQKGEDIKKDDIIIKKGHKLRAQDIGALAGTGRVVIDVFRKPTVSIVSTGDEIIEADSKPKPGQVRDINSYTLSCLICENGGIAVKKGILKDNYEIIKNAILESLLASDMVLITGGTSAGAKDMTADIIDDIGRPGVLFHGVAIKPGKPMIGGVIDNKPVLGLPGHPAAIVICFNLFIKPLLNKLSGLNESRQFPKRIKAKMFKAVASAAGREDHIRVSLNEGDDGLKATPVLGKSGLITTLVRSDGVVAIPPQKLGLDKGEEVIVELF
ncbi:MAG: molybdopterin-binding protein [Nitrospirae bacterium]|nr:molybdopterin-binding protein [Nitrospirota bacterium]